MIRSFWRAALAAAMWGALAGCSGSQTPVMSALDKARSLPPAFCADATPLARAAIAGRLPQPLSVEPLSHNVHAVKFATRPVFSGASLVLPAPEGMTAAWLQRTLVCHQADVALGTATADADDPFVLPSGWLDVAAFAHGGTVVLRLEPLDPAHAGTVLARAQRWSQKAAASAAAVTPSAQ